MANLTILVDKMWNVKASTQDYKELRDAMEHYEAIQKAVEKSSLARDGMEMIEAAMRGDD